MFLLQGHNLLSCSTGCSGCSRRQEWRAKSNATEMRRENRYMSPRQRRPFELVALKKVDVSQHTGDGSLGYRSPPSLSVSLPVLRWHIPSLSFPYPVTARAITSTASLSSSSSLPSSANYANCAFSRPPRPPHTRSQAGEGRRQAAATGGGRGRGRNSLIYRGGGGGGAAPSPLLSPSDSRQRRRDRRRRRWRRERPPAENYRNI